MPDLLLELFSEEIPARMQAKAAADLKKMVTNRLVDAGLTYEAAQEYWTPRRLTLDVRGVEAHSKDREEQRKGPSCSAPQQAISGFLRSVGLDDVRQAEVINDPKKGDFLFAKIVQKGRKAEDIIANFMPDVLRQFPWPKSMRWGADSAETGALRWVRPLQNILCLFGPEIGETAVVDFAVGSLRSNNVTYGHRFMSNGAPITVRRFEDYVSKLEQAKVVLDAQRRKEIILADARNLAFAQGLELVEDEALAKEVSGLVEWPVVLMGQFDTEFLVIPPEIIQLTIRINQKCFVLRPQDNPDTLSNHFILVSNIETADGGTAIAAGNGKVVRARLSDALYFWQTDQANLADITLLKQSAASFALDLAKPLDQRMARLDHLAVTFHAKLGTQGARVHRIINLAAAIAPLVGADIADAKRAATLAKADLQTEMVGEFPELQGLMGHKYALLQGEHASVAAALEDHYKPQGPADKVPRDAVSIAVALADKIDTLVGFWSINEKPTGSKDPYALRRAALGVIRLLLSREWTIALKPLLRLSFDILTRRQIEQSLARYEEQLASEQSGEVDGAEDFSNAIQNKQQNLEKRTADEAEAILSDLLAFLHDRLRGHLRDEGARYDAIDAVLHPDDDDFLHVTRRVEALITFINQAEGAKLLASAKRSINILDAEMKKNTAISADVDPALFIEDEEKTLFKAIEAATQKANGYIQCSDFSGALNALAVLSGPIDAFFDKVLVNDDNVAVKNNRFALLKRIQMAVNSVAHFSKLVG